MEAISPTKTLASTVIPLLQNRPTGVAFVQQKETGGYREVAWREISPQILRLSSYLEGHGIGKGDRVLILSENCPEWSMAAFAVVNLGAILVPVASMSTVQELMGVLQKSQAKFCFFSRTVSAYKLIDKKILPPNFVWDIQERSPLSEIIDGLLEAQINPNQVNEDDIALLIYTSGTTGTPKAVPLSHRNILVNAEDSTAAISADEKDVVVSVLPLSHMLEFTGGLLLPLLLKVKIVYVKSLRAEDILRAMQDYHATILIAVPLLFEVIARNLEQKLDTLPALPRSFFANARRIVTRYPSLRGILLFPILKAFGGRIRYFVAGGAKLQPWVYEFFQSIGIPMLQGYGLTETSPVLAVSDLHTHGPAHVGKPLQRVELALFNDQGEPLPANEEGEIWARGPSVFHGYENPEHNRTAFQNGWFCTGDLGRFTSQGYVEITGRKKDVIVTPGGKKVYPEELENALSRSGKFLEVCVMGMRDEQGHEKITAVLRPDRSKFTSADKENYREDVENAVHEALRMFSDYMQPQRMEIYELEFPKTHTRKVKRFELRNLLLKEKKGTKADNPINAADLLDENNSLQRTIGEAITTITQKPFASIRRSDKLLIDLGLDSLTFVEILSAIEKKFLVHVDTVELATVESVDDLIRIAGLALEQQGKGALTKEIVPFFSEFQPLTGFKPQWRVPRLIMNKIIKIILRLYCRINVYGKTLVSDGDSFIFTANHTSHFDSLSIVATLPYRQLRKTFTVAAKDYFFNASWKAFLGRLFLNAIPFDRKKRVDEGMKKCKEIIDHGGSLIIFPEGTRSVDGQIQPFKPGVGSLLCRNRKVKAVPVYIDGAYSVFPKGSLLPRPNKLRVVYGNPISFSDLEPSPENYSLIARRLQDEVVKLKQKLDPPALH